MMKRTIATAALAGSLLAFTAAVDAVHVDAGRAPCADSNGSKPGGSVYFNYTTRIWCDVTPPQRLHRTNTPSLAACDQLGGRYDARTRICWDVDY